MKQVMVCGFFMRDLQQNKQRSQTIEGLYSEFTIFLNLPNDYFEKWAFGILEYRISL